jgi:hypothetical protein
MAVSFPSEYAVFPYDQIHRKIKVYSLDAFTLAPFSVANVEYAADRGMLMLLRRGDEIPIALARPSYFRALNTYCA